MKPEVPPPSSSGRFLVVIGNFDGVHLGHRAVLAAAQRDAASLGLSPRVLTFDPHPREVVLRTKTELLTTLPDRIELIRSSFPGVEVWVEPFTQQLSLLEPEEFARQVLRDKLGARAVLVGEGFRFGRARKGDLASLVELGQRLGFQASAIPLVGDANGQVYSSSRVREHVKLGEVEAAATILGRPHRFSGVVIRGDGRGRLLGFPTANLEEIPELLPGFGVYAVAVELKSGEHFRGVLNHGPRPTVDRPVATEVHLLGFDADLYGDRLRVHLLRRLRDVQKFDSREALVSQIRVDAARAASLDDFPPSPNRW